jgi:mycothiol S-conjugate amidase
MPTLCLLTVHAHPDDESSKGAGTVAKYHAAGVRTVLVTATGGEEGDILNPAMDRPGVKERMAEIRREELTRATEIIGYDKVYLLGYRDSGMPDSPANADPRSFAQAPLEEAVGRLVEIIRAERPQVIVTYAQDQSGYPHPDHLRVNEISELAFDAAGDPDRYPELGEVWQPVKLYYTAWSARRMHAVHEAFLERGMTSPFSDERLARMIEQLEKADPPTTMIDIRGFAGVSREALRAHATQVDPSSGSWFGLPPELDDQIHPYEEYHLARDLTGTGRLLGEPSTAEGDLEDDLFDGIATAARP